MTAPDKQLIVVVEGTPALGIYWPSIVTDYIEKIVRSFCGSEMPGQNPIASTASESTFELGLVMFNAHDHYSGWVVQKSSWTKDVDSFLGWLSSLTFSGGGLELDNAAIAEGLSEALMMFAIPQNGYQTQQTTEGKKHCILVAASNPYPLPTPVYRPQIDNTKQGKNMDEQTESRLFDAETVAQWFGQCSVSLSVICPKQLQKLRALYSAGKHNARVTDLPVEVKQSHFLVLMPDSFTEARGALSRTGLVAKQSPVTSLPPISVPTYDAPSANQPILNRPPVSIGNIPQATVKVEPTTVTYVVSGPSMSHMPSIPHAASQVLPSNDVPEVKPMVSMSQSLRPVGATLNNLFGFMPTPQIPQSGIGINSNVMSNICSTGVSQQVQPGMWQQLQPGMPQQIQRGLPQQVQQGMQNVVMNNSSATNMPMSQQASSSLPSAQSKYAKVWEGSLFAQRHGEPVLVTRLEGYRRASASESLAANWPPTMHIIRLISEDHINNKHGKALFFRAMTQHGFLQQLQERKLCAVIQLPSQTLLLFVCDKAFRLVGMLFPSDLVVFKQSSLGTPSNSNNSSCRFCSFNSNNSSCRFCTFNNNSICRIDSFNKTTAAAAPAHATAAAAPAHATAAVPPPTATTEKSSDEHTANGACVMVVVRICV